MKRLVLFLLLCVMALYACDSMPQANQKVRREVLNECLERSPKDPKLLNGSSWEQIINACGSQAYNISLDYNKPKKKD